jgi:hypothetical protein
VSSCWYEDVFARLPDWQPQAEPVRRVLFATRSERFEAIREEVTSQTIARALNKLSCALARSREQRQVNVPACLLGRLTKLVQLQRRSEGDPSEPAEHP